MQKQGKRMTRIRLSNGLRLLVGLLLFHLAGTAAAQQPSQAQIGAIKQSCRTDYQSYCSSVPTGGSAAMQCLQEHMGSLSHGCQTAVSAAGAGVSAPPGQAPQAAPSSGARAAAPPPAMSPRQEAALMRRSCGDDFRAYCRGVSPGGGRGLACLSQNQARLSPSCKSALVEARGSR